MSVRQQHKVKPGQEGLLLVELLLSEGLSVTGVLGAIGSTGAAVRFAHNVLQGLALHQEVALQFANPQLTHPITLRAYATARRDDGLSSTYELWFVDPRVAEIELVPRLKAIFNERAAARAEPDPAVPVPVALVCDPLGRKVSGRLVNVSTRGLSMRIPAGHEPAIAPCWYAQATLRLPGLVAPPLDLACVIRQRRSLGKEVELGLEFRQKACEDLRAQQEQIAAFVLSRQQAKPLRLQMRRGPPAA